MEHGPNLARQSSVQNAKNIRQIPSIFFLYITLFTFSCHIRSVTAVVEQGMDLLRTEHKPIPIMFRMLWIVLNSALALSPVFKLEWKVLFPRLTGPKGYLNGDITLILMRKLKQDRASNEFICK